MNSRISADTLLQRIASSRELGKDTARDLRASTTAEAERSAERALDRRLEDLVTERVIDALEAALSLMPIGVSALGDPNDTAGKPEHEQQHREVQNVMAQANVALDITLQSSMKPYNVEAAAEDQISRIAVELLERLNQQRARG